MQSTRPSQFSLSPMRVSWSRMAIIGILLLLLFAGGWFVYRGTSALPTDAPVAARASTEEIGPSEQSVAPQQVSPTLADAAAPKGGEEAAPPAFLSGSGETGEPVNISSEASAEASRGGETSAPFKPNEDPANDALGGVLTTFRLDPLAAPCCPLPTDDKAVEAAQGVPGVLAADIDDAGHLLVRYDPAVTDANAIASTVNQASFIVEIAETTP